MRRLGLRRSEKLLPALHQVVVQYRLGLQSIGQRVAAIEQHAFLVAAVVSGQEPALAGLARRSPRPVSDQKQRPDPLGRGYRIMKQADTDVTPAELVQKLIQMAMLL